MGFEGFPCCRRDESYELPWPLEPIKLTLSNLLLSRQAAGGEILSRALRYAIRINSVARRHLALLAAIS